MKKTGWSPAAPASSARTSCAWRGALPGALVNLDLLTYAGNPESLADLERPRHVFVHGDIGDRALVERLLARAQAPRRSSTSRPRATWTAPSTAPRTSSRPTSSARSTCSTPRAATGRASPSRSGTPSGSSTSPPTRSTAPSGPTTRLHRDDAVRPEQPLLGLQGRLRPPGAGLPPHLRPADAVDQLLEQLRPLPVPREADPPDDPERSGGQAAAGLRRRPERPRLALRRRPLRRHSSPSSSAGARARPTTSAAGTSGRT